MGHQKNACAWSLEKNLCYAHMTCSFVLPFSVWWWGDKVIIQVLHRKKNLKKEKIRSLNDAWQGYLKTWDQGNSQIFQGHCPWTPQRGLTMPHRTPQLQGPTPWRTSLPSIHPKPCTGNAVESACIIAKFSNSTRTNSFHTVRSRESSS